MFWHIISYIPLTLIITLYFAGIWDNKLIVVALLGTIVSILVAIVKYISQPFLSNMPWLRRPEGAQNCDCFRRSGDVSGQPGFPSGHAALIVFLVCSLLMTYKVQSVGIYVLSFLVIFLVCLSRIAIKCHTPLQVVAGVILGGLMYSGSNSLYRTF
jgi:membrane-associated phospholipid phosphatase